MLTVACDTTTSDTQTPPLDGPTANEADLDRALFGPWDDEDGDR